MNSTHNLVRLIRRPLGRLRAVLHRLKNWGKVTIDLRGCTPADQTILSSAIFKSPITVWQDLDVYQFPAVESECTVISRNRGVFFVRPNSDDLFHALPNQEPSVEKAIYKNLKRGGVFIDAGSNIGYYSILASKIIGDNGIIYACEMFPSTVAVLKKNIMLNNCNNISLIEGALSLQDGEVVRACLPRGKFGSASIIRHQASKYIEVKTTTLAKISRYHQYIDCIKLDLEGAELPALQGLGSDITKVNSLVFEDSQDPELTNYLIDAGFNIKPLDARNSIAFRIRY